MAEGPSEFFGFGSRHDAVIEIRDRLRRVGLMASDPQVDQRHYDQTVARAVAAFQQQHGLVVDGLVNRETFRRLEEARWQLGDRELAYTPGRLTAGEDVTALQRRLTSLGYDCGRVDGLFGPATEQALRAFQEAIGITVDGRCGSTSVRALQRLQRAVAGGSSGELRDRIAHQRMRTGVQDKIIVCDVGPDSPHSELARNIIHRVEGQLAAIGSTVLIGPATTAEYASEHDRRSADFANDVNAHVVLSPRVAIASSTRVRGVASYYFGGRHGSSHLGGLLAQALHARLITLPDAHDCGTHARGWPLLRYTRMPCVCVEIGYATNPSDLARLTGPGAGAQIAGSLAAGLIDFFAPVSG